MPYVQCKGADLYYENHGEGQPIVFLHGVMCSLRYFESQLTGLSNEYRTIAVDFRGHGRSEKTDLGHTVAQYARDLHSFVEQRDLEDVVFVGWSMVIAGVDSNPANREAITEWAREYWRALHEHSAGGSYINFMMEEGQDRVRATYGDNYERLGAVKARYDPDNVFHINQNIQPAN